MGDAVLRFASELIPALLVGLLLGLRFPQLPSRLAAPLVDWGVPLSLVGLLLRSGMGRELLVAAGMAALVNGVGLLLLLGWAPLRRSIPHGGLQLGAVVGNTGYFGIPVAVALLPAASLGFSISYDLVGTLITWSVGPLLVQGLAFDVRRALAVLWGSPASKGLAIALGLHLSPWGQALGRLLWWPSQLLLLLALSVVGMRLGVSLRQGVPMVPGALRPLGGAVAFKLLAMPLLMLALSRLIPLPLVVRDAVVLQAAAPTAVSALLLAEAAGRDAERTAHLVLATTLLALVTVPLWWGLLSHLPAG
jgi:predicted permease